MRVKMKTQISGSRDGKDWPMPGEELDVSDEEGASLCANGQALPVKGSADETEDADWAVARQVASGEVEAAYLPGGQSLVTPQNVDRAFPVHETPEEAAERAKPVEDGIIASVGLTSENGPVKRGPGRPRKAVPAAEAGARQAASARSEGEADLSDAAKPNPKETKSGSGSSSSSSSSGSSSTKASDSKSSDSKSDK